MIPEPPIFSRALLKLFLSGIIPFVGAATLWSLALSVYAIHSGKALDGFQRTRAFVKVTGR